MNCENHGGPDAASYTAAQFKAWWEEAMELYELAIGQRANGGRPSFMSNSDYVYQIN